MNAVSNAVSWPKLSGELLLSSLNAVSNAVSWPKPSGRLLSSLNAVSTALSWPCSWWVCSYSWVKMGVISKMITWVSTAYLLVGEGLGLVFLQEVAL